MQTKLQTLPRSAGVYFHKNETGEIIYIGKASVLKNRVRSYFQNIAAKDTKTQALVAEIYDTDWIETDSEIDALFLESEMVKRYKPRYNVLLRDDKSQLFVRINMKDELPYVTTTRQPADDGADYFGPYFNGWAVKKALRLLRPVFPHYVRPPKTDKPDFDFHLRLSPGVETGRMSSQDYKKSLRQLISYLKGNRRKLMQELEKDMKRASKDQRFEEAVELRDKLRHLGELQRQIVFGRDEFLDVSKDEALAGLRDLLGLKKIPRRIEGYDISHMSGTNNAASMVVASNGLADKAQYRKFKLRLPGNNDFAHMNEALSRRFSARHTNWPQPDLIVIDGGKGQLDAALKALEERGQLIPIIGLAKRQEEIIIHRSRSHIQLKSSSSQLPVKSDFISLVLPKNTHIVKLLQRIRDESHRFAVSYHTVLKRAGQTSSQLDQIDGIGPKTRTKLLRQFGSLRRLQQASVSELAAIVGRKKAELICREIGEDA
ncbi:MAG: excinuclease ABC subunit UvrC [Segetibacter sp.]